MCGSMVDIQSPTTEIRREEERTMKPQGKNIMACPITQGGHNQLLPLKTKQNTTYANDKQDNIN